MANEVRLIDANALMKKVLVPPCNVVLVDDIKNAPTIDQEALRPTGRWEQVKNWATKAKYRCSICGREIMSATKVNIEKYPYCHCGAKMEG